MTRLAALLLLLAQGPAPPVVPPTADAPAPPAATPPGAPGPARPRPVPDSALAALRADPAFQYGRPRAEQPSLLDRFWRWLGEYVLGPLLAGSATRAGQGVWLVAAVLVLVAVALRLFRAGLGGLFGRRDAPAADAADPLLGVDDIAEVALGPLLDDALARHDWRAAVRLRYLLALQQLDARGTIAWGRDKTDRTLVREATARGGPELGRAFADVTRAFESVWYGGLAVDAARWARIDARFQRLDEAIATTPAPRRPPAASVPA